jgi:chloramphenicol 3-O phosphotransferase
MTIKGNVIFLNGTSSAGKATLTKKLQKLMDHPYYHLSLDVFEEIAPQKEIDSH